LDDSALRELATGPLIQRLNLSTKSAGGLDECTREMFALAMLVRLGNVTEEDIRSTFAAFRTLDLNNDGVLNSKSIIASMIAKRRLTLSLAARQQAEQEMPPYQQQPEPSRNSGWFRRTTASTYSSPDKPSGIFGSHPQPSPSSLIYSPSEQSSLMSENPGYNSYSVEQGQNRAPSYRDVG
jgi:hypothetical protein